MNREQSLEIIAAALKAVISEIPSPLDPNLFLMKDLGLESVDLLNLLVEIERRLKTRLDLIEIMRNRDEKTAYSRDLQISDLSHFMVQHGTT